ncbi:MAG TPA: flagellar biosynthetic protein FliQ [Candidatus Marinimicrobia bacterium]|nr:flagellar biosynthetic protein FliQ [Candidatus Neomarinimicrobiota bacterium]
MNVDYVIYLSRETMTTATLILAPILLSGLIIGLTVAIFQAITSIQEMTLTFIPKMGIVGIVIILLMPWFLDILLAYTQEIYNQIVVVAQ